LQAAGYFSLEKECEAEIVRQYVRYITEIIHRSIDGNAASEIQSILQEKRVAEANLNILGKSLQENKDWQGCMVMSPKRLGMTGGQEATTCYVRHKAGD
jgi:hypothetical protein